MKKKAKKVAVSMIDVMVSRFGHDPIALSLPVGATVQDALDEADITLGGSERAYVAGEDAAAVDILEDGDVLSIVTPKGAGSL